MPEFHPDLLARPVPRYTSYPTAAEFDGTVGETAFAEALGALQQDAGLSLYLHIPYCREICWYCGCNTGKASHRQRLGQYLDALDHDLAHIARALNGRGVINHIAFGGGSPNAILPVDFARLVDRILTSFSADSARISIEVDPRSFGPEWQRTLKATGTRRASLGVQTLDPRVQSAIGRVQPEAMICDAIDLLRASGVDEINADLMYGLPYQDEAVLIDTLDRVAALGATSVSLFGYAHLPHMVPRQRRINADALPDVRARFNLAATGHARLCELGYVPIGFDHFALPGSPLATAAATGTLRRNFQGFTADPADALIGVGASAISSFSHALIQNEKNVGAYRDRVAAGQFAASRGILRDDDDCRRGAIIEQLLCFGRADLSEFGPIDSIRARLADHVARGLVEWQGNVLAIAPEAWPYARTVAVLFDRWRQDDGPRFSHAI